mmetsp:Transcript_9668/g.17386  ORF Transcript_9668/g.17386 Transcript_9668/m.17386 type:complete len:120 (+) Transcript_9668:51-410(+)
MATAMRLLLLLALFVYAAAKKGKGSASKGGLPDLSNLDMSSMSQMMFQVMDLDKNGYVTHEEFEQAGSMAAAASPDGLSHEDAFKNMDKDGDGKITPDEAAGVFSNLQNMMKGLGNTDL